MLSVISITAPRPAVDWFKPTPDAERAPGEALLPADRVTLSSEARAQLRLVGQAEERGDQPGSPGGRQAGAGGGQGGAAGTTGRLTPEQQQEVRRLQQRDAHVRAHEAAHQAAGGSLTGPASYTFQVGPDGRSYAVGGEVPVLARTGRTPEETIAIARRVRAAALAPGDPSSADLSAAATATQLELQATEQRRQEASRAASRRTAGAAPVARAAPRADLERIVVRAPEPEPFM